MDKIILYGYWFKNLGDDLFLLSLMSRIRKDYRIYISCHQKYSEYYKKMSLNIICCDTKLSRLLLITKVSLLNLFYRKFCIYIFLGGSLFMENKGIKEYIKQKYFEYMLNITLGSVIGSNFGPFKSKNFYTEYYKLFSKMDSICFRDEYSKELFSDLRHVRYAPDVILAGEWEKGLNLPKVSSKVVISVINLENRSDLCNVIEKYENMIASVARYHASFGEEVVLVAFCAFEGDVAACERIKNLCGDVNNIEISVYENFDFLSDIKYAKKIYGTRFHSIILAMYYGVDCVPFIYNEKTKNALESYCKEFKAIDLLRLDEYNIMDIINNTGMIIPKENLKIEALDQFKWIDSIIKDCRNENQS